MVAPDGAVFDIVNIVPYLKKHRRHPVTGAPLELKDLTRLVFHRNADGDYQCPVLNKARRGVATAAGTATVDALTVLLFPARRFSPSRLISWA